MITAIGTGIGEEFNLERARYHKVVRDLRRRRRRRAHPHADPDVPVPAHEGADRGRLRLHRPAAALPAQDRPRRRATSRRSIQLEEWLMRERLEQDRGAPIAAASRWPPDRGAAAAAPARASRSTRAGRPSCKEQFGAGGRRLRQGPPPDRARDRVARRRSQTYFRRRRCPTTSRTASRSSAAEDDALRVKVHHEKRHRRRRTSRRSRSSSSRSPGYHSLQATMRGSSS